MRDPVFLMCPPSHFEVTYDINPWMTGQAGQTDRDLAHAQWAAFHNRLSKVARIELIAGASGLPDMVFTANAGLLLADGRMLLARFRHPERQGEEPHNKQWLEGAGYAVVTLEDGISFEGAGDALYDAKGRLWVGAGFRSDPRAIPAIQKLAGGTVIGLALANPSFYHLDTCFCPLESGGALAYLPAFSAESQRILKDTFGSALIELQVDEAATFACNAVSVGGRVFLSVVSARIRHALASQGLAAVTSYLGEFLKAGGSAKCLTLRI